jgi:hypothetical protein
MRRLALGSVVLLGLLLPGSARAVDPFEIQVYDGTANAPGVPGLELHVNRVFDGVRSAEPPELPPHHQTHLTLEPSFGVTPFWELGAYLQSALLGDGSFDYAGAKLRSKFVSPPGWHEHLRIGLNLELSILPRRFDRSGEATELRPILAWESRAFLFALNPIVGIALASPGWREGPSFEPALMALYKWREQLAFGIEYYADLGAFASGFQPWSRQEHYLFEAVNLTSIPRLELNLGIGEGLTAASNSLIVKMIVGYAWEPSPPKASSLSEPSCEGEAE